MTHPSDNMETRGYTGKERRSCPSAELHHVFEGRDATQSQKLW